LLEGTRALDELVVGLCAADLVGVIDVVLVELLHLSRPRR